MLGQLTGIEAHQIALDFFEVFLQQSGRGLPEHSEHARCREYGQLVDLSLLSSLLQPILDLTRETSLLLLDVMCHAVPRLRPQVFMLWKRVFKHVIFVNVGCWPLS